MAICFLCLVYIALYLDILAPIHHSVAMLKFYDPVKVVKHIKELMQTMTKLVIRLNEALQSDGISANCMWFSKIVVIKENGKNYQSVKLK